LNRCEARIFAGLGGRGDVGEKLKGPIYKICKTSVCGGRDQTLIVCLDNVKNK